MAPIARLFWVMAPSRLAMRPGGYLYVATDNGKVMMVNVNKAPQFQLSTVPPPTPEPLRTVPPAAPLNPAAPTVVAARKVT